MNTQCTWHSLPAISFIGVKPHCSERRLFFYLIFFVKAPYFEDKISKFRRKKLIFRLLMFSFVQSGNYLPCLFHCHTAWCHPQANNPISDKNKGQSHKETQSLCLPQHQSSSEHKHKKRRTLTNVQNPVQKTCFHSPRQFLKRQRELL